MKIQLPLLSLALALTFTGCTKSVNTVDPTSKTANPYKIPYQEDKHDIQLTQAVKVLSLNQAYVSGNMLQVQATIQSKKPRATNLNYRFDWINRDGMFITSPPSTWKNIQLQGNETSTLSAVAPTPNATDFRLTLLEGK